MLFLKMLSSLSFNKLLLLGLLIVAGNAFAQQDAAINKLIDTKVARAKSLVYSNTKLSGKIADTVIRLSMLHNNPISEATGWNIKGIIMSFVGNPDSAIFYFAKTEKIGRRINDKLTLAKALQNKNLPLSTLGRYDQAMQACQEGIKLFRELNNLSAQAGCLGDMGNIMIRSNKPEKAIEYLIEALQISDKLGDETLKPNFYNSLAVAYLDTKQYNLAERTYLKALPLAERFNRVNNQISILINLGDLSWQKEKNVNTTGAYYLKAEKLAQGFSDDSKLAIIYRNLGVAYSYAGDNKKAIEYTLKAKDLAIKRKDIEVQEQVYSSLALYASKSGDFRQAYQSELVRDSLYKILFNKRASENMNELQTRYETEKKQLRIEALGQQNQIQQLQLTKNNLVIGNNKLQLARNQLQIQNQDLDLLQKERLLAQNRLQAKAKQQQMQLLDSENRLQKSQLTQRNIIIGFVIGLLIIGSLIAYLLYNRYRAKQLQKQQQQQILLQQQAASAVMQAETNERNRIAGELHDGLGQLFSAVKMNLSSISEQLEFRDGQSSEVFSKTLDMVDESCREVRAISHQMAPNVLLKSGLSAAVRDFINKIDARKLKINLETFGLHDRIDQNTEAVLYRVIQEAVNNVIKHAGATSLDIQLNKDEEGINAMIEDNGRGFEVSEVETFNGIGLKNISSRVAFLQGKVDFSSSPGQGTLIAIHIPI
jgi:two-component system NarL family sensor kinase